jgi:hypothetical protein
VLDKGPQAIDVLGTEGAGLPDALWSSLCLGDLQAAGGIEGSMPDPSLLKLWNLP